MVLQPTVPTEVVFKMLQLETPVIAKFVVVAEVTVRLVKAAVVALMLPLMFNRVPEKVKLAEVATPLLPLPYKRLPAVKMLWPVPPLPTANTPEISLAEDRLTVPLLSSPLMLLTTPVVREDRVVEPLTATFK